MKNIKTTDKKISKYGISKGFIGILIIGLISMLFLGSCKKWLEIKPAGEIIDENYWQNEAEVMSIVSGCYRSLCESDYMERIILWGEGRSDNVKSTISDEWFTRMVNMDLSPTNSFCTWSPFYRVINRCNVFLEKAPGVVDRDPNFTKTDFLQAKAEILTIRALSYFYLVRAFRNVPWKENASLNDNEDFDITQSSDTFVLSKIISDLQIAYNDAPETYFEGDLNNYNTGRITKNAVAALLADIYLWDKQYENCVLMCNRIIDSQKYKLVDYDEFLQRVFISGNSTESIFELQFGAEGSSQPWNSKVYSYYFNSGARSLEFPDYLIPSTTLSPFNYNKGGVIESAEDLRYLDFVDSDPNHSGSYFIFKYVGVLRIEQVGKSTYYYENRTPNWIIYRLADILLMKAEALVQLNRSNEDLQEAMDLVNETYIRANPKLVSDPLRLENYASQTDMSSLVLRERQRELLFEGKRYFDLMRYAIRENSPATLITFISKKTTSSTVQIGPQSIIDAIFLPVNSETIKKSPSLKQNPYYVTAGDDVTTSK